MQNAMTLAAEHDRAGRHDDAVNALAKATQGGDLDVPRLVAPVFEVTGPRAGFVNAIDTEALGHVIIELGGGRKKLGETIDHATGLEMLVRLGDRVEAGQPLIRVFANPAASSRVQGELVTAIAIGDDCRETPPLIAERIR